LVEARVKALHHFPMLASRTAALLFALLLASCGGDDESEHRAVALDPDEYTLEALMNDVFIPTCSSGRCHTRGIALGDLILDENLIEHTVGITSRGAAPRVLVVAGEPGASYLFEKISTDAPTAGARMPLTGTLPARDIARIRAWIAALEPR
jgi:hypothetical protein